MSRHQDFRNVQGTLDEHYFDDDDGYSEGEQELSPEDKALMQQGTEEVRAALGIEAPKVTTEQIQEALWHYYYDVDKSVTYLISRFIAPPPSKASKAPKAHRENKIPGKHTISLCLRAPIAHLQQGSSEPCLLVSDQRREEALKSGQRIPRNPSIVPHEHNSLTICQENGFLPPPHHNPLSLDRKAVISAVFRGIQWGNIPKHRDTVFIEPPQPRGGLLGGSAAPPKLSKLQQLAASRKKKQGDKKAEDKTEKTLQKLDRLSVHDDPRRKENISASGLFRKKQKLSDSAAAGRMPVTTQPGDEGQGLSERQNERHKDSKPQDIGEETTQAVLLVEEAPEPATPSTFAQTLLGPALDAPKRSPLESFSFPYTSSLTTQPLADAFSKPSPDDLVLAAQAQGSVSRKSHH